MPTVILLRHGRTTANASGILAGWTPQVHLDSTGRDQADAACERILAACRPAEVISSPLVRCRETAEPLRIAGVPFTTDEAIGECHYGAWTGRSISDLAGEDLWRTVQTQPSAVEFPPSDTYAHETMAAMQARAVAAIRAHDRRIAAQHGEGAVWVAVSHGDVIKAVVADALGTHLDQFQRIIVSPASLSIVRHTSARPYVMRVNDTGGDLSELTQSAATTGNDATVGGSTGTADGGTSRPQRSTGLG